MNKSFLNSKGVLALLITGMFLSAPASAEKPEWAGKDGDKREHHEKNDSHNDERHDDDDERHDDRHNSNVNVNIHFGDHERVVVRDYYEGRHKKGHCPPGLRKKHNGCMPPGHAKKWHKGRPLPRDVVYHDLPPRIIVEIGAPPAGHKYVRVAADILLIAVGTGMVVDAIEDLGRI
jgi:Ni/Co efflux regulator RcnB